MSDTPDDGLIPYDHVTYPPELDPPGNYENLSPMSSQSTQDYPGTSGEGIGEAWGGSPLVDMGDNYESRGGKSWVSWEDMGDNSYPGAGEAVTRAIAEVRDRGLEDWQLLFVLARHLKAVPGFDPDADPEPVRLFCGAVGIPPEVGEVDFVPRFLAVRAPAGLDVRAAAAGLARSRPVRVAGRKPFEFDGSARERAATAVAGFGYYLWSFTAPRPFILTWEDAGRFLVPSLGTDRRGTDHAKQLGGRALKPLVAAEAFVMVKDYVPHQLGREYVFAGTVTAAGR